MKIDYLLLLTLLFILKNEGNTQIPSGKDSLDYIILVGALRDGTTGTPKQYFADLDDKVIVKSTTRGFYFEDTTARTFPNEFFDDKKATTQILFKMKRQDFNKIKDRSSPVTFQITTNVMLKDENGLEIEDEVVLDCKIDNNGTFNFGNNVEKLREPIKLNAPEELTTLVISNSIKETLSGIYHAYRIDSLSISFKDPFKLKFIKTLYGGNHKDSAYVRAIELLNTFMYFKKPYIIIGGSELDDLLTLYLYSKDYLEPNSFYNQEARQLKNIITNLEVRYRDSILSQNDTLKTLYIKKLTFLKAVYDEYLETSLELLYHYSRTEEMLFNNRTVLSQKDQLVLWKNEERNYISQNSNNNSRSSFGGFIVPARLRLGENVKFASDLTIGASINYLVFKKQPIDLVAGVGLSSVSNDSAGVASQGSRNAAYTQTLGFAIAPTGSNFQIGIFTGIDIIGGNGGKNWIYQGKPWFSLGVTYRLKKPQRKPSNAGYSKPFGADGFFPPQG